MYSFKSRVRFSETDINRKLSLTGLMNYLQDCSIFQSEDIGAGFSYVQRTKKSWLLSAWNVEVIRRPDVAEEITVATWPYDFKGIYGLRNFAILDKDGNYLVKADSCWFLTDTVTGRPVRPTAEDTDLYPVVEPRMDMEDLPRKITLPMEMKTVGSLPVMKQHLDTNHHVNNVQYVRMAMDYLPEGFELVEEKEWPTSYDRVYSDGSKRIKFVQLSYSSELGVEIALDNNESDAKYIDINGNSIVYTQKNNSTTLVWIKDEYVFKLVFNFEITKDEWIRIVEFISKK